MYYRARDSSASTFDGALRGVSIVGRRQDPRGATSPHTGRSHAAPTAASNSSGAGDDSCSICLGRLFSNNDPVAKIQVCDHHFHDACVRNWLQRPTLTPSCPTCRAEVPTLPKATSPSGTMTIQLGADVCPGYGPNTTCLEIIYSVPTGLQHSVRRRLASSWRVWRDGSALTTPPGPSFSQYHENPNTRYPGTTRRAYLPDNDDGRQLLKRLKVAFERGLTFDVGTSLTSGWHDQVVWNRAFDHKTSLHGGPYGFPDPNYLRTTNIQLNAIGIPDAASLPNQPLHHGEVVSYDAPQDLGPPVLMPGVLVPVPRQNAAIRSSQAANQQNHGHLVVETPSVTLPDAECSVCHEPLSRRDASQIILCNHVFHRSCILSCLSVAPRCPICRRTVGEPQGPSPSGSMTITCQRQKKCPGFGSATTVTVVYRIPSGIQEPVR